MHCRSTNMIKGTVMQIEKALTNDRLHVSEVSWKFCIATIYNFVVIYPWNLLFFKKQTTFLHFMLSSLFINKTLQFNNLKPWAARNAKTSVFVIWAKVIITLLLYNLHDWTFKVILTYMSTHKHRAHKHIATIFEMQMLIEQRLAWIFTMVLKMYQSCIVCTGLLKLS